MSSTSKMATRHWNFLQLSGTYSSGKKYKERLPVKVTDTMRFARVNEGIDIGEIISEESARARGASFKKVAAKRVTVTWPANGNNYKH